MRALLHRLLCAALVAVSLSWPAIARAGDREASGFAVLAREGATDAAWSLARAIYARDGLRPLLVDEAHARILAGEPPPKDAPLALAKDLGDLAETRAAIRGDDAPSRQLLASIATTFELRGILVVEMSPPPTAASPASAQARARLFFAKTGFDAAQYLPDEASSYASAPVWSATVRSLARAYGGASDVVGPAGSTQALPRTARAPETEKKPFYASPWFWGAVGAAVFAGGALYLATRDNTPATIHLQVQVPK